MKSTISFKFISQILFSLIFTLSGSAFGNQTCNSLLSFGEFRETSARTTSDYSELKPNRSYRFIVRDKNQFHHLVYRGKAELDFAEYLRFTDVKSSLKSELIVPLDNISLSRRESIHSPTLETIDSLLIYLQNSILAIHNVVKTQLSIFKTYFSNDKYEVIGDPRTKNKEQALSIVKELTFFDQEMQSLGFERTAKTRIIIGSVGLLPDLAGPHYFHAPILNLWNPTSAKPTIAMNPFLYTSAVVNDRGVLFHERTHYYLLHAYSKQSFINSNKTVQEALADFFAAVFQNDSTIGQGYAGDHKFIRDIENKQSEFVRSYSSGKSLLNLTSSYHDNSMIFSHVLWDAYKSLDPNEFKDFIKSFLDNLNSYYESYRELKKSTAATNLPTNKMRDLSQDFEYFLSVFLITSRDRNYFDKIKDTIDHQSRSIGFSFDRVSSISQQLKKSEVDYTKIGRFQKLKDTLYINSIGVAGVYGYSHLIWWMFN